VYKYVAPGDQETLPPTRLNQRHNPERYRVREQDKGCDRNGSDRPERNPNRGVKFGLKQPVQGTVSDRSCPVRDSQATIAGRTVGSMAADH